jgi:hypothetical protein
MTFICHHTTLDLLQTSNDSTVRHTESFRIIFGMKYYFTCLLPLLIFSPASHQPHCAYLAQQCSHVNRNRELERFWAQKTPHLGADVTALLL